MNSLTYIVKIIDGYMMILFKSDKMFLIIIGYFIKAKSWGKIPVIA